MIHKNRLLPPIKTIFDHQNSSSVGLKKEIIMREGHCKARRSAG